MKTLKVMLAKESGQWLLLAFLLLLPTISQASYVALVIGNQSYPDSPLSNPAYDADAVAQAFESMGYDDVSVVKDADTHAMDSALDEFSTKAATADVAVIYYAGHGVQIDGKNYLVPVDVSLSSSRDIRELTTQQELTEEVALASEFGLVILDACRDNPFVSRLATTRPRSVSTRGLAQERAGSRSNTLVAYATASDDIAADGMGRNSPYTTALLRFLSNPDLDIYQLFGTVRDTVVRSTDGQQVPYHYGSTGGQRYFLHPKRNSTLNLSSTDNTGTKNSSDGLSASFTVRDLDDASYRILSFKDVLVQKDWAHLLDSRSLSAIARQNIDRWRGMPGDMDVSIENVRGSATNQTVYADVVVTGADSQPDRVTVQVVRSQDGSWSTVNW